MDGAEVDAARCTEAESDRVSRARDTALRMMKADDAGTTTGDDAGTMVGDDAGTPTGDDVGTTTGDVSRASRAFGAAYDGPLHIFCKCLQPYNCDYSCSRVLIEDASGRRSLPSIGCSSINICQ